MLTCFLSKQKTAFEMRISDWNSDVCSSDLANKLRYYIGGGYNNLQGPVINSSFDRYSLSSKLSGNAGTNVTFTNSLNAVRTVGKRVQADIAVSGANSGDRKSTRLNSSH